MSGGWSGFCPAPFCLAGGGRDAARFAQNTRVPAGLRAAQGIPGRVLMRAAGITSAVSSIAIAALLAMPAAPAQAQQGDPAIRIGASDFGGVVTGPNGPEAGVWVIAETTDLPTKFAKIVVTDDRAATSSPTCPRRTTTSGCAATASSIRRRQQSAPGKLVNLTAVPAPSDGRGGRILSRACTGIRCSRSRRPDRIPRHRRQGQRHPEPS